MFREAEHFILIPLYALAIIICSAQIHIGSLETSCRLKPLGILGLQLKYEFHPNTSDFQHG